MISAEIICDSISREKHRLTTFQLRYPKFIHAEFMTHRMFSRNASSSRAIPTSKLIEEVRSDFYRAAPVFWGRNQKGMQASEELAGNELAMAQGLWRTAALDTAIRAETMMNLGIHKQIVNRVLEPFLHINVICTATEYANFFALRLHKDAQPEMRRLAELMMTAYQASTPRLLEPGQWHLPYVEQEPGAAINELLVKISVARCARVSYTSFETGRRSTIDEDLKLYDRLLGSQPIHASPAEHQATPDKMIPHYVREGLADDVWQRPEQHGNFIGWIQYRKTLPGENCTAWGRE
jgi:thymidylate synthase ThyX